jgi:hypothetical protein
MQERTVSWRFGGNGVYVVKVTTAMETMNTRFVIMR